MRWLRTPADKAIPIDPEPVQYGGNIVVRDGKAHFLKKGEPVGANEPRYRSHFVTCEVYSENRKAAKVEQRATKAAAAKERKARKQGPTLF